MSVRLDAATMARVDALSLHFSTQWRIATRSDVLRVLVRVGLDRYESDLAPPPRHPLMQRWAPGSEEKEPAAAHEPSGEAEGAATPPAGKEATAEPPEQTPSKAGTRKRQGKK